MLGVGEEVVALKVVKNFLVDNHLNDLGHALEIAHWSVELFVHPGSFVFEDWDDFCFFPC